MRRAAVILAGGKARRMGGGHKALLPLGKARVIDYILKRLSHEIDDIALNINENAHEFAEFHLTILNDQLKGFLGPLAGIHSALLWGQAIGVEHILTVAGDTPFFPTHIYSTLEKGLKSHRIAMAASENGAKNRHPTFALWPTHAAETLEAMLNSGTRKIIDFADALQCTSVIFKGEHPFFNINTPEDLTYAQERALQ